LEVDAHPLAITSAFGELVYSVLIDRIQPDALSSPQPVAISA
jgi:hypothetical protein